MAAYLADGYGIDFMAAFLHLQGADMVGLLRLDSLLRWMDWLERQ